MTNGPAPRALGLPGLSLVAVLLVSTLYEGGAAPTGTLITHTLIAVVVLTFLVDARPRAGLPALAPLGAFVAFVVFVVVGAAVAPYGYAAFLTVLEVAAFLGIGLAASRLGRDLAVRLAWPLLLGAAVQGALAVYQRLAMGESRPDGTFLNPNHLGAWLVAAMLVGL
ncbi:MAG: hypothetical protein JSV95_01830, partial [Gemmatimonadota bacterium]